MMNANSAAVSVSANWPCALFCCGQLGKYTPQVHHKQQQQEQQQQEQQQQLHIACNTPAPAQIDQKQQEAGQQQGNLWARFVYAPQATRGRNGREERVRKGGYLHTLAAAQLHFLLFPSLINIECIFLFNSVSFQFQFHCRGRDQDEENTRISNESHKKLKQLCAKNHKHTHTRTFIHIYFYLFNYIYSASIACIEQICECFVFSLLIHFNLMLINIIRKSV